MEGGPDEPRYLGNMGEDNEAVRNSPSPTPPPAGAVQNRGKNKVNDSDSSEPAAAAAVANEEKRHTVKFSVPRDITSEDMSFFPGGGDDDSPPGVSVQGIVEYGGGSSGGAPPWQRSPSYGASCRKIHGEVVDTDRRKSSLEIRRENIPESTMLTDRSAYFDDGASCSSSEGARARTASKLRTNAEGCFRRFFLNPSYPLRKQMMLTFGTISSLTILVVMLVSIIASVATGNAIRNQSNELVGLWVGDYMFSVSRFVSEALSPKVFPQDLVQLLVEVATDRFAGYPTTEDDSLTPFFDTRSQTNIYPLKNEPLPMDWDFRRTPNEKGNVNGSNFVEHVQYRWPWYAGSPRLSTVSATYHMQGACDPRANESNPISYHPNCTDANNDIATGGAVAQSPTNAQIYRKGADLSPFLKALHESSQDMKQMGYYFSNSGAGSTIFYPHYELDATGSYESIGCEWMRAPNPVNATLGPIGTDEEIARCHPKGTVVPTKEYNPMERAWCRDQALDPSKVHVLGPYLDAWGSGLLLTIGRAVYDLVTQEFISCIAADLTLGNVGKIMEEVKVEELGIVTLVRNDDDGTVVTSPKFDYATASSTTTVDDPMLETGITVWMFESIKSIDGFLRTWDGKSNSFETEDYVISAYPIPSVPDEYDPTYEPQFYVFFSVPKTTPIFLTVDEISQEAQESVKNLVTFTVICGGIGLALVLLLIFAGASLFVKPLKWMSDVGDQVVGNFGGKIDSGIEYEMYKPPPCFPKTELSSLVGEFNKMVFRFSGEGTAKRMKMDDAEKLNLFEFGNDFAALYRSREDSDFPFKYPKTSNCPGATEGRSIDQCHLGENTRLSDNTASKSSAFGTSNVHSGKVHRSPLFHWMVALIGTPIILTTVLISTVVLNEISTQLPSQTKPVKDEYFQLRNSYRYTKTNLLAISASEVAGRAARETHFLTRFASWLYFDGIRVSRSFTKLVQGAAEECKTVPPESECKWGKDMPCDCAWNDFYDRGRDTCREYPSGSRRQQELYFEGQSQDVSESGSRYSTSYPLVATFPNMTAWWDDIAVLPGSTEEFASSNYDTTFARVKTYSALSTVMIPLYNYDKGNDKLLAAFVGFEADGMFAGYGGCWHNYSRYAFWMSSEDNGAFELRPELCPLGKYGFDARCRGWYADGKRKAMSVNRTALHITAPYVFAGTPITGQSTSSPLIDSQTQEHVGQTIVDFQPGPIFRSLRSDTTMLAVGGFPIMITPESDVLGHDTVIGPGFSLNGKTRAIQDLLQADNAFESILQNMKAGNSGSGVFTSTAGIFGSSPELLNITYAPIVVKSYRPLNSSDIASGVEQQNITVFSIAFLDSENSIETSLEDINKFSSSTAKICVGVVSTIVIISMMLIVAVAFLVTKSMSEPILQLLDVMEDINCMRISNDDIDKLTEFKGSCHEVDVVYKTMEMLYKVVQFANHALFSGDLEVANKVLVEALRLFLRLDNKKAIAVASNNLGNTMLTIYRTMKATECEEMCGLSKKEVIEKGSAYFARSIKLGEDSYDQFYNEQGWSEECLVFMQFLANRYFNRAIFFLTTSCDNENRKEAESLGFRDLQITSDMDVEIVDQCLEMGFKINRVERHELMMSRVRGLLALVQVGYSPDELFIEDQINEVYQDLINAMKNPSHELFKEISATGRMQKLDIELIKYLGQAKKDNINAARVAIRMLVEDEYIITHAQEEAFKMILTYMSTNEDENCPNDANGVIAKELRSEIEILDQEYVQRVSRQTTGSLNFGTNAAKIKLSDRNMGGNGKLTGDKPRERRSSAVLRESIQDDVVMEIF